MIKFVVEKERFSTVVEEGDFFYCFVRDESPLEVARRLNSKIALGVRYTSRDHGGLFSINVDEASQNISDPRELFIAKYPRESAENIPKNLRGANYRVSPGEDTRDSNFLFTQRRDGKLTSDS